MDTTIRSTCASGILLALLLLAAPLGAQETDLPASPDDIHYPELRYEPPRPQDYRVTLANGAILYIVEDHQAPCASVSVMIRGGSYLDPAGKEGLAEMAGALARSGGTEGLAPTALDQRLDDLAAQVSVSFGLSNGGASLWCLSQNLPEVLGYLADILYRPRFDAARIELYRTRSIEDLRGRNDDTRGIERREFTGLIYGDHPLNRLETEASLRAITVDDLRGFLGRVVRPYRMVIAAAGDFRRDEVIHLLEQAFPADRTRPEQLPPVPQPGQAAPHGVYVFDRPEVDQGRVTIGHLGVRTGDPDEIALQLLNHVLGGGSFTSRLVSRVRSDEGLAYHVGSRISAEPYYPGTFQIAYQSKTETVAYALRLCLEELQGIRERGVTEDELAGAKAYFVESFPQAFGTRSAIVETLARAEFDGRPQEWFARWRDRVRAVTTADILRVARERLHPDALVTVVVGDATGIAAGDGVHEASLDLAGPVTRVPLPADPLTMSRPASLSGR